MQVQFRPVVQFGNKTEKLLRHIANDNAPITFREADKALNALGFTPVGNNTGSHRHYVKDEFKLTVPAHNDKDIVPNTVRKFIKSKIEDDH